MEIKKELIDEILKNYQKPEDVIGKNGLLKQLTKALLERAMDAELTHHLGYEKSDPAGCNSGNSRNGASAKTLKGDFGELVIETPRDRNGSFEPQLVKKHQTRWDGFDDKILSMYARGMSAREIQGHLQEMYGVEVSPTLISEVWKSHSRKAGEVHCWRPRRGGYGELVQWDTSTHDWLEGRGESVRYLVRLIDDATSRSWGRFVAHDGTRENMGVLWEYLERNGRMVDVYTDRAAMFMVPLRAGESAPARRAANRLTQMGRALREMGIGWIAAYSPQAKGRIERSFETDQDRLVKELRLAKVTTMPAANRFLKKEYWPEWNARFARSLEGVVNLHRPLTPQFDLAAALSHVEQRVIRNDYTVSFAGRSYQIGRKRREGWDERTTAADRVASGGGVTSSL